MAWYHRIQNVFRRDRIDDDIDAEISFHLAERIEELREGGLSPEEARKVARQQFGNRTAQVESAGDMHISLTLEALWRNLRLAARSLSKSPGFTVTVVLTLALGIGANSAVFSAIDAVLLQPLPFPDADRLVKVGQFAMADGAAPDAGGLLSPIRLEDWNRLNETFESLTGYYNQDVSETSGELPEKLTMASVSPRMLETWGVAPLIGRGFEDSDHHVGEGSVVLIRERFWRSRFGGDPAAIGKVLRFGTDTSAQNEGAEIIGVLPDSFFFLVTTTDVWSPIPVDTPLTQNRDLTWYNVNGRLKPGVTLEQAQANLNAVQTNLGRQYPDTDAGLGVAIEPLKYRVIGDTGSSLWLLYGAVFLLLMIACINIAALLLARATHRVRDVSVRFSLGASRRAIVGQLLAEALILAATGAVAGLAVAALGSHVFQTLAAELPRVNEIHLDGRIVGYTLACAIPVTILCGLLPALRVTGGNVRAGLAENVRSQVSSHNRLQWLLVGAQVALAVALLSGAGLLARSMRELGMVSAGFETGQVLTFNVTSSYAETNDWARLQQTTSRLLEGLQAVPGVEQAATALLLPGVRSAYPAELDLAEGRADSEPAIQADLRFVSDSYFATMRIPLVTGSVCEDPEWGDDSNEVMVNRSFADRYFPGATPVGLHILNSDQAPLLVRGIVGDAREGGLQYAPQPTVYICGVALQPGTSFAVLARGDPAALSGSIRRKIAELEPGRSVYDIAVLDSLIDERFQENTMRAILIGFFAVLAVALAMIGLYGTLSYLAGLRRREVALRLALGSEHWRIVWQFLWQGLGVSTLGALAGLGLAVAFGNLIASMLFGISPTDVPTLSGVIVLTLLVTGAASLLPAWRASRVEPMNVLRDE